MLRHMEVGARKEKNMYKVDSEGWIKHADFIILDMLCLQIAYVLAYGVSGYGFHIYAQIIYRNMAVFLELADFIVIIIYGTMKSVLKRSAYRNFVVTFNHGVMVGALALLYLFLLQEGAAFSRATLLLTIAFYIILTFAIRELRKRSIQNQMQDGGKKKLLVVTSKDLADTVIADLIKNNYARYSLAGAVIIDEDSLGKNIQGVEVVATEETAPEYVCRQWIDEVFVYVSGSLPYPDKLMEQLTSTGVTVHLNLTNISEVPGKKRFVGKVGNYTVLTTSLNYASAKQLLFKRCMDIAGGLVGCLITGILCIFLGPIIYISSPGPIFFGQERVGKNGKTFKMYKFRSMYMDAEARKADLMKENKLADGKMFKMDFDPRVIGNKILPDGSKKTGIGDFIRRTSLDEFPQFFNVLKGDMSIVGTRPPLPSETSLYELHHRARLAIKPGITGMWQVSGRSDITDFEEVVKLDREYIENWNIELDLKILFKTVLVVLLKKGSV